MTDPDHPSGTDRLQQVASILELGDEQILVNVRGDEPMIPAVINQVAANLADSQAGVATLAEPIEKIEDLLNPNVVKVVCNEQGMGLYFSRAPIPGQGTVLASWHQSCRRRCLQVQIFVAILVSTPQGRAVEFLRRLASGTC